MIRLFLCIADAWECLCVAVLIGLCVCVCVCVRVLVSMCVHQPDCSPASTICQFLCLPASLFVRQSAHSSLAPSHTSLSIYLSLYLSIYLFIYLSMYLSIHPSIHSPSIYLSQTSRLSVHISTNLWRVYTISKGTRTCSLYTCVFAHLRHQVCASSSWCSGRDHR